MKRVIFFLFLILSFATTASAQEVPRSREDIALSFAPVVKNVAPAVVSIYTRAKVRQRITSPLMEDPFFRQFFGDALPYGLSRERVQSSLGSGVIVRDDGMVVTNNHVIDGADEIRVVLSDKREFPAEIVTADKRSDLAVLHIKSKSEKFPVLELKDSDELQVGDLVLAVGNPFGVGQTVTMGIVSAVARAADVGSSNYNYFIQTDAAINPGNSGGALVDTDGKLVGVPSSIYSRDGGSLGIGFAIPSNLVRTVIAGAGKGAIIRGWLGFSGTSLTPELAQSLNMARPVGVIVDHVHPLGPAHDAGLQVGDVILTLNGKDVSDAEALRFRIATTPLDSAMNLHISRKGQEKDISVRVIAPPELPAKEETVLTGQQPLQGARIANLSPKLTQDLGLEDDTEGVVVLDTAQGSIAARLGMQRGDLILAVNKKPVKNVRDAKRLLVPPGPWQLTLNRGGDVMTVILQ
jgi:serine protease Do